MSSSDGAAKEAGLKEEPQRTESNHAQELYRSVTAGSISPELFERLYLSPRSANQNDLRKTLANPTPLAVMGFSVALMPLSIAYMGWRGAGGDGVATGTASLWFGGVLLYIAGIMEFITGNTFPFMVFMGYGSHFFTLSTTFMPAFNSLAFYTGSKTATGVTTEEVGLPPAFLASYGYYTLSLAILSLIYLICSVRTNAVFVMLFAFATVGFGCVTGAFFQLSQGNMEVGGELLVGTGACFFGASMMGWYLLASILFDIMELPIPSLPVFDLSTVVKAKKRKVA